VKSLIKLVPRLHSLLLSHSAILLFR